MSYTPPGPSSTLSPAATVGVPVPQAIRQGLLQTAPLAASVFTYGLVFGALSRQAGLSTLQALLMSALVYAGSAQFLALGMLTTGATALPVIISTLIVNLRHLLMGASLAPYLKGERPWRLAVLAAGEVFGELALLDQAPRAAQARATADCVLVVFFRADFMNLLETHPKIASKIALSLARHLGGRLRQANAGQRQDGHL